MKHFFAAHYFRAKHWAAGLWQGLGLALLVPGMEYRAVAVRLHYRALEGDPEAEDE